MVFFLMFIWWVLVFFLIWVCFVDRECDFVNRVLVMNLDMDLYGFFCKRFRLDFGLLNGSNGVNGGYGGVDDCKFFVYFVLFLWFLYVCLVCCFLVYFLVFLFRFVFVLVFII